MAETNHNQDNLAWLNNIADIVAEGVRLASPTMERVGLDLLGDLLRTFSRLGQGQKVDGRTQDWGIGGISGQQEASST